MMRAATIKNKSFVVSEVPVPQISSSEVLVKVEYCGICGTDVHRFAAGGLKDGVILGHEVLGYISKLGENVEGWKTGERVIIFPFDPCRKCRWCLEGNYHLCPQKYWIGLGTNPGGFAEYLKVRPEMLLKVPDLLDDKAGALVEPLAVALHAVRNAKVKIGDSAVVIGAGPIGLLVLQGLQLSGISPIGILEIAKGRASTATRLGADIVLDPQNIENSEMMIQILGFEPDIVFDCAGSVSTLQLAGELVTRGGSVVLVGVSMKPLQINALTWGGKELTMKGTVAYCNEFPLAIDLLAKGAINVNPFVENVIPLEEIDHMIEQLQTPNEYIKILVKP
jgi:(R,R)-butanediol dehydrogenase / meso-butanediol dehydrogenase / diacetyl reductase